MRILSAAAAATLAGGAIGFFSQGNFGISLISILLLMGTVPLLAVFAGWAALSFKRTGEAPGVAKLQLVVFGAIAWTLLISMVSGSAIERYGVSRALQFSKESREAFDNYRKEHGHYPNTLEDLQSRVRTPRFLQKPDRYKTEGDHYTLSFTPPSAVLGEYEYDSRTDRWMFLD